MEAVASLSIRIGRKVELRMRSYRRYVKSWPVQPPGSLRESVAKAKGGSCCPLLLLINCPHKTGSAVPSRVSPLVLRPRLNLVLTVSICLGTPPRLTFQARLLHNHVGANAENGSFRNILSRAFFRHIGRCSHPFGCGAIEPGKSV